MKLKKYQKPSGPIAAELTPSQAIKYNNSADSAAFMIPYGGTPENPEFLYPAELRPAVTTAGKSASEQKKIDRQVSKLTSNNDWLYRTTIGGKPEHPASRHGKEYVRPLTDAATIGIGGAMGFANPVTTTLAPELLKGAGHATKVVMNPLAAETTVGSALGVGADAYLTATGLYNNSKLIDKWGNGNFNWSDIPEFTLNILGATPYANATYKALDGAADMSKAITKTGKVKGSQAKITNAATDPIAGSQKTITSTQHFDNWRKQNNISDNYTIDDIERYMESLDVNNPSEKALKSNWDRFKSTLLTDDTYYRALTPQEVVQEFHKMAIPENTFTREVDKELVARFYKEQRLPRLIANFKKSNIKVDPDDLVYLEEIYSNPYDYVPVTTGYFRPGTGGHYDSMTGKIVLPENADITTLSHELHHGLRDVTGNIISKYTGHEMPEELASGNVWDHYNAIRFLPSEIETMRPLAMAKRYRKDKTPILEIPADVAGAGGLEKWLEFYNTNGRFPSVKEFDDFIDETLTLPQARWHSYNKQIGSHFLEHKPWYRSEKKHEQKLLSKWKDAMKHLGVGSGVYVGADQIKSNTSEDDTVR